MYVSKHVDWLSFTVQDSKDIGAIFPLASWHLVGKGLHGYEKRFVDTRTGAILMSDSADPAMGIHIDLQGDTLDNVRRADPLAEQRLLSRIARSHGKSSRMDLAINMHELHASVADFARALDSGQLLAKASRWRFVIGKNGEIAGDTLYIGSPNSDRQCRIYNKAAEQGIVDGKAWVRLELELRRLRANGALNSCADNGTETTINGHFHDFLSWQNAEYVTAIEGPSVAPIDIPRRASNRQRWLLGQVCQALAKELALDDDFLIRFLNSTFAEVERIQSVDKQLTKR